MVFFQSLTNSSKVHGRINDIQIVLKSTKTKCEVTLASSKTLLDVCERLLSEDYHLMSSMCVTFTCFYPNQVYSFMRSIRVKQKLKMQSSLGTYRIFTLIHRNPERFGVLALKHVVQQTLALVLPRVPVLHNLQRGLRTYAEEPASLPPFTFDQTF